MAAPGTHSNVSRALTAGEIALCRSVFPDPLPYEHVRLWDGPAVNDIAERAFHNRNTAITLRRTIYFRVHFCPDFARADDHARELFLHEMTHVWQWFRLGVPAFLLRYAKDLIACRGRAADMYRYGDDGIGYHRCRLEAQAQLVGDYQLAGHPNRPLIAKKLAGTGLYGL